MHIDSITPNMLDFNACISVTFSSDINNHQIHNTEPPTLHFILFASTVHNFIIIYIYGFFIHNFIVRDA